MRIEVRIGGGDAAPSRSRHHAQVAITGFENHLIFYIPQPDGVSIVRVLHAARDWWSLLGLETSWSSRIPMKCGSQALGIKGVACVSEKSPGHERARSTLMRQITEFIEGNGCAQIEVGTKRGVTQPHINNLLHGRISRSQLDAHR
ncbi:MAG: XRE family transcriptional regulator [Nitrospira sp.]|nr:XRE family transcriptional regulator [Nitrospira sp.]